MDELEEYIRKNREDLDQLTPSSYLWKKIKRGLKREKSLMSQWLTIAAMVVAILGTAVIFLNPGKKLPDNSREKHGDAGLSQTNPQFKETEVYYNNLINSLYSETTPLLTGNPEIKKELNTDISKLDSICSEIKKDLKDNVANQEVVEALVQNYRIKIRILEDMLIVLKENKNNPEKRKSYEL
jgi:hypothetical protein